MNRDRLLGLPDVFASTVSSSPRATFLCAVFVHLTRRQIIHIHAYILCRKIVLLPCCWGRVRLVETPTSSTLPDNRLICMSLRRADFIFDICQVVPRFCAIVVSHLYLTIIFLVSALPGLARHIQAKMTRLPTISRGLDHRRICDAR